jgi:hypothetical protein
MKKCSELLSPYFTVVLVLQASRVMHQKVLVPIAWSLGQMMETSTLPFTASLTGLGSSLQRTITCHGPA